MPRVKALTTGSIPGFLDMILNIAESDTSSTLTTQDNWLAQIRQSGKTLTMFGDDTWLKLFPNMFTRSDGTTSFFVSVFLFFFFKNFYQHANMVFWSLFRTLQKSTTMSHGIWIRSFRVRIGMLWSYIISVLIISDTSQAREGEVPWPLVIAKCRLNSKASICVPNRLKWMKLSNEFTEL